MQLEDPDCISDTQVDCAEGCSDGMVGDGECQNECNVYTCKFDHGDCHGGATECSPGCWVPMMLMDNVCSTECQT